MAVWRISVAGDKVALVYETFGKQPQQCGGGELALFDAVEEFAMREAQVWDIVTTPRGSFVRQVDGAAGARA